MKKPLENTRLFIEIHQQPSVIQKLVSQPQDAIKELAKQIRSRKIRHIFIAARGTSDNAGIYAKYILAAHNRIVVSLAAPSLFTIYQQPPDLSDSLVLGISQSGKSPDIVSVLNEAQRQGALTASITNIPDSDLGKVSDIVLDLGAGEEISLAATKTYTAQLTCLALLSAELDPSERLNRDLQALPAQVQNIFDNETTVDRLAERYRYMSHCAVIGRGFNYATAFEFSLKMKELTYTIAEPYSSADFLHGPVALIDQGFPTFVIAPAGVMMPEMKALIDKVQERHAEVIVISDQEEMLAMGDLQVTIPSGVPEWLSPITTIIPGQMFAMFLAKTRKIDVDNPRGLSKVTETW